MARSRHRDRHSQSVPVPGGAPPDRLSVAPPGTAGSRYSNSSTCSSRAPRATVGGVSLANVNKSADNQDTFGACNAGSSRNFVGVFDGHGEMGHHVSRVACDSIQRNLFNSADCTSDPRKALERAYKDTQTQLINEYGQLTKESGTTAVAAYQNKHQLFVANVGDSRAVIGRCSTGASRCSQSSLRAIDLSSDHKPDRLDEQKRIESHGGKVGQSMFPVENMYGGVSFVRAGPARVMSSDGMGGLAMSRSLGDAAYHPHVIAKPEIHERKLDSRDKLLILGSDGVWDQMTSQEAVSIARRHKDPNDAAQQIADISKKRWMAETGNQLTDDITAVVMQLDHRGAPPSDRRTEARSARLDSNRSGGQDRTERSSGQDRTDRSSGQDRSGRQRSGGHRGTSSKMDTLISAGHPSAGGGSASANHRDRGEREVPSIAAGRPTHK